MMILLESRSLGVSALGSGVTKITRTKSKQAAPRSRVTIRTLTSRASPRVSARGGVVRGGDWQLRDQREREAACELSRDASRVNCQPDGN